MNGRFLLDTNAIIALLQGENEITEKLTHAEWIGISIISYLEFLVFPNLPPEDHALFLDFASRITVVGLEDTDMKLIQEVIHLRKAKTLKLPDAIIVATAMRYESVLLTRDQQLLRIDSPLIQDF